MIESGTAGYLTKDASRSLICDAIRAVITGQTVLGLVAQESVGQEIRDRKTDGPGS